MINLMVLIRYSRYSYFLLHIWSNLHHLTFQILYALHFGKERVFSLPIILYMHHWSLMQVSEQPSLCVAICCPHPKHTTTLAHAHFPLPSLSLLLPLLRVARALPAPLPSPLAASPAGATRRGEAGPCIACSCRVCGHVSKLGFLPVDWSGAPNPDQIWRLWLLCFFLLPQWSKQMVLVSGATPSNKIMSGCVAWRWSWGDGGLPLAGLGGEGRKLAIMALSSARPWRGNLKRQKVAARLTPAGRGGEGRDFNGGRFCCSGGWRFGGTGAAPRWGKTMTTSSPSTSPARRQLPIFVGALHRHHLADGMVPPRC
jgi:hypothetical protein